MKTNIIQAITTSITVGLIAGFGATKVSGDALVGLAVTGSYLAVVAVIAIAASDYRSGSKPYFAAKVATSHFKQAASVGLRTQNGSARLAA